jgi:hypothetical protein
MAEAKLVLHLWLRSGNTHTARGVVPFFRKAVSHLPANHAIYAVRADSGFCLNAFMDELERDGRHYVIVAKFTGTVKFLVVNVVRQWRPLECGYDVGETTYQALGWTRPRRLIVVRELIKERPNARGRKLIDVPGYTFHAFVTTVDWPPETVWRFYNSRADCENRIKEIAEYYGAKGFCVKNFFGTEAAVRLICFLFNVIALFKEYVFKDRKPMLNNLRVMVFATGSALGMDGGRPGLRIALKDRFRERFKQWLARLEQLSSTAPHLTSQERNT